MQNSAKIKLHSIYSSRLNVNGINNYHLSKCRSARQELFGNEAEIKLER